VYGLSLITPPSEEPVSLERAKLHLRVDDDAEDDLITALITAARQYTESHTSKRWVSQGLRLTLPEWCCGAGDECGVLRLPCEPVSSVESVKYYATTGTLTTLVAGTDYQTWLDHFPPLVAPAPSKTWPTVETGRLGAIQIEFTAGYADAASVPENVKSAVLLCVGHWYEHRGDSDDPNAIPASMGIPPSAKRLLDNLATGAYL